MDKPDQIAAQLEADLGWSLTSPCLVAPAATCEQLPQLASWSDSIDQNALLDFVQSATTVTGEDKSRFAKGFPVGRYFELLFTFWLERIRQVEIVAKGFQVQDERQTIGELDFVFRDESGQLNHWELAAKFYLYVDGDAPQAEEELGSHLIGPNAADTFERKVHKLFGKQLPLSKQVFPDIVHRVPFVKGRIFYHPSHSGRLDLPDRLADDHLKAVWIRHSEIQWLEEYSECGFVLLTKPFWLGEPVEGLHSPITLNELFSLIRDASQQPRNPLLVSVVEREHSSERLRVFVMPDHWPACCLSDS